MLQESGSLTFGGKVVTVLLGVKVCSTLNTDHQKLMIELSRVNKMKIKVC